MKTSAPPVTYISLRAKINGLVLLNIVLVLTLVMSVVSYLMIHTQFEEVGKDALTLARIVADMPQIRQAFHEKDPTSIIQPLVEGLRKKAGAEFIVVGNMSLIRYSHPNPALLGKPMVGGDDDIVLNGKESITEAVGTLGLSIRGKSPIFDENHRQVGIVSVGFLVDNIWKKVFSLWLKMLFVGFVGLVIGLIGAHVLSGHIKRQILNLEPFEIAFLAQKQAAILESIREGVLAVDSTGKIAACNQEAKRLLKIDHFDILGKSVDETVPHHRLVQILKEGPDHLDLPMIIGNSLVIVNRVSVMLKDRVIGAVATFRDKMKLEQIEQRLADVSKYAEALRSQRHEFMNKLHTISGLIQMGEHEMARELIAQVHHEQQQLLQFFMTRIRDSAVVGILIGKMHRAKELGIELTVDPRSHLKEPCPYREILVTILGNAIENALEAMTTCETKLREKSIIVYINDQDEQLVISVKDSGPGIDPALGEKVFEDGVTTKGAGRGFGLSLLAKLVANVGGKLAILSSPEGATLEARLPLPGVPENE
ncbi:sensor histidine kinase [Collibacillus ludicampi]|jgi:two-component system CitB family sensor kinase|uniref:histidine kinase n=1 Tax=Collibacillus ludicampi TaxID=2771369 RepID=A0AAV4LBS6_9BACL|nr:sensor histidine kinase [Collibacillus ludicampi]GIM45307.1 sensor histidine kinase [Collibacillus ludicampi]